RPCDGIETAESWELAIETKDAPSLLSLTRQGLPTLCKDRKDNMTAKGAYILKETKDLKKPDITLMASGSEVSIAMEVFEHYKKKKKAVRLVSCPCLDLFWEQDAKYIKSIIGNNSLKVAIEAGIRQSWDRMLRGPSIFIGMDDFGASAPADELYKHFGITAENTIEKIEAALSKRS
ncbi:MAG: transketolase, partial [Alphaproteobacteria bacterium]|nr:transketolase [Alphaproteobacteria bacterium]